MPPPMNNNPSPQNCFLIAGLNTASTGNVESQEDYPSQAAVSKYIDKSIETGRTIPQHARIQDEITIRYSRNRVNSNIVARTHQPTHHFCKSSHHTVHPAMLPKCSGQPSCDAMVLLHRPRISDETVSEIARWNNRSRIMRLEGMFAVVQGEVKLVCE